jgi:ribosomal protein S18 acetylase RimI-like enzyme
LLADLGDYNSHAGDEYTMLSIRKMQKNDIEVLYNIALHAFQPDYEKYGMYPPLINLKRKKFLPPRIFGKTILDDGIIIGGAFVAGFGKKGQIGAIFLDTHQQHNGYGKQAMLMIEKMYPKVKRWRLETPAESFGLHRFYESLGYVKAGEVKDKKSGMSGRIYEKMI